MNVTKDSRLQRAFEEIRRIDSSSPGHPAQNAVATISIANTESMREFVRNYADYSRYMNPYSSEEQLAESVTSAIRKALRGKSDEVVHAWLGVLDDVMPRS